jgi:hypothetical protein
LSASDAYHREAQLLEAGRILQRFVRVGYAPDVAACVRAIEAELGSNVMHVLAESQAPDRDAAQGDDGPEEDGEDDEDEAGRSGEGSSAQKRARYRAMTVHWTLHKGRGMVAMPLSDLLRFARDNLLPLGDLPAPGGFFSDNEWSQAVSRVGSSHRWFSHGTGVLRAVSLTRGRVFELDSARAAVGNLDVQWRSPVAASERPAHARRPAVFLEGASAATDIRVVCDAEGMATIMIRARSREEAFAWLHRLAEALDVGAADVSPDVEAVVAARLTREALAHWVERPAFWRLAAADKG